MAPPIVSAIPAALSDRMVEVLRRAMPRIPEEMRSSVASLLTGENLRVLTGVFAAWTAAHAIGAGELLDLGLLSLGILSQAEFDTKKAELLAKLV